MEDKRHGYQIGQSVQLRTLDVVDQGSKPALGTWWWGWISPNKTYPNGSALVAPNFPERD